MSNPQRQTMQSSGNTVIEGARGCYPPASGIEQQKYNGQMLMLRTLLYQREVLSKDNHRMSLIYQLCSLDYELKRMGVLYMGVKRLAEGGLYRSYAFRERSLRKLFDELCLRRIMTRSVRQETGSVGLLMYGLAPAGKALLREYYEYLGGAHDDKLDGLR